MTTRPAGAGQAGPVSDGLSGLVNRIIAWADRLQRKHGVPGFPYAVVKKYGDDEGGRQAALITYYGFLSVFPLLLLGVAVLSRVLADHPDLRRRLITAIVPQALRSTVEHSLATLPTSTIPLMAGLIGLLLSGTGVVFSAECRHRHGGGHPRRRGRPAGSRAARRKRQMARNVPRQAWWPGTSLTRGQTWPASRVRRSRREMMTAACRPASKMSGR